MIKWIIVNEHTEPHTIEKAGRIRRLSGQYHPDHNYKYIVVKKDKKLWGYAVVSVQEEGNGLVYGIMVDYLVKYRDIACFLVTYKRLPK